MKSHARRTRCRRLQKARRPQFVETLNARTVLLGLFMVLTVVFASSTVYESGLRTTLTSTSTLTSTATSVSTTTTTSVSVSTVATTSSANLTKPLTDAYLSHIGAIVSANGTALAAQYETNATLLYDFPDANPSHGSRNGIVNIQYFYGQGFPGDVITYSSGLQTFPTYSIAVANDTYSIAISNDLSAANVTSHLVLYGNDPNCPIATPVFSCSSGTDFYYVMRFDITYTLQGGSWLISTENVTNINMGLCYPASLSADGRVFTCPIYAPS
jgi:hypothetical protein